MACAMAMMAAVHAEDDSIITDRPDFVESSDVVGLGRQQVEVGLSLDSTSDQGVTVRNFTTPTLLRLGLGRTWEARIETDGLVHTRVTGPEFSDSDSGVSDASVGVKFHLQDGGEGKPGVALLLHADLPSGSPAFRGEGVRPSIRMVGEWELSDTTSLGVMPGVVFDRNEQHHFTSGILAATYGVQLNQATHGFVEVAGQQLLVKDEDGGNVITFDTGMSYLLDNETQVDASLNLGLTRQSPDWTIGVGFAHRFGKLR